MTLLHPRPTRSIDVLRDDLLSGAHIDKGRLIHDTTIDFLDGVRFIAMTRSDIVNDLFAHVHGWIAMTNELHGRRMRYQSLTPEQVALIIIKRHDALSAPVTSVPAHWHHEPLPSRATTTDKRVLGVRLSPPMEVAPRTALDVASGYYTSPLMVNALIGYYRPSITTQQQGRVRNLLRQWSPVTDPHGSATTSKEV